MTGGTRLAAALALASAAALAGCSSGSGHADLSARGAYVPQPATADMAGGYVVVENAGDAGDELTSVTSDISDEVQMHEVAGNTMRPVEALKVPPHGRLELRRGGSHLMLMHLDHKPVRGERVALKLHFAESGPITVNAPVEAINYNPKT